MKTEYDALKKQVFTNGEFKLVPIRYQDRILIMQWRNEQIYHLRQSKPLTKQDQDNYFDNVVTKLFEQSKPKQILFSFLKNDVCIGYGGLVHVNWVDKHAEISFVMNTGYEEDFFVHYWSVFLGLVELVAFVELAFHKIFTFAFDLRPKLYDALNICGYHNEAQLKDHCYFEKQYLDVFIHSKILYQNDFDIRSVTKNDCQILFDWANDASVRQNALNSANITLEEHTAWFAKKINDPNSIIIIFSIQNQPLGQLRLDFDGSCWWIDYSIEKSFRGKGYGTKAIKLVLQFAIFKQIKAVVKNENLASQKVFLNLGFQESNNGKLIEYKYQK